MLLAMECCYYYMAIFGIEQQVGLQQHVSKIHLGISVLVHSLLQSTLGSLF